MKAACNEFRQSQVHAAQNRNRRNGEFMHELDLTEERSTSIPKILKVMAANGSPVPLFETDDEQASFVVRLPVHPLAKQPTTDVAVDVTTDVTVEVAALLRVIQGDMRRPALQAAMGLRNAEHFRKAYLVPAIVAGYLKMPLPDTPRSTRQRYPLTPLGLQRQRELKGKP